LDRPARFPCRGTPSVGLPGAAQCPKAASNLWLAVARSLASERFTRFLAGFSIRASGRRQTEYATIFRNFAEKAIFYLLQKPEALS